MLLLLFSSKNTTSFGVKEVVRRCFGGRYGEKESWMMKDMSFDQRSNFFFFLFLIGRNIGELKRVG